MKNWLFGLCIVAALSLMGSEGRWFPLPNLVGAGIFLVVAAMVPRASYHPRPDRHHLLIQDRAGGGTNRGRDFQRRCEHGRG